MPAVLELDSARLGEHVVALPLQLEAWRVQPFVGAFVLSPVVSFAA